MADIQVHCGSCANTFLVSEDMAGLIATCPKCERQISVPLPEGVRESRPKLQMKKEGTVAGGKRCPVCSGSMAAEAVICVQCGYDTRTGRTFTQHSLNPRMAKPIFALLGAVILGGIVWTLLRPRTDSGIMGDAPPVPASPPAAVTESAATVQPPPISPPPQAVDVAGQAEEAAGVEEGVESSGPSLEEVQQRLTAALNARYPMYIPGSAVMLRRINGLVHRGQLVVYGADSVTVKTEEGDIEVPFDVLDRQTRMLCDAEFRRKYVEHRSRQAVPSAETF